MHIQWRDRVLEISDNLPKYLDFPAVFGGSDERIDSMHPQVREFYDVTHMAILRREGRALLANHCMRPTP